VTDVVYFVRRGALVKIGTTGDLPGRLLALDKGYSSVAGMEPGEVELLATMPGGRPVEKSLHELFAILRYAKEWFFLEEPLAGFIRAVAAAEAAARARHERAFAKRSTPWIHVEEYSVPEHLRTQPAQAQTEVPADGLVNLHEATGSGLVPMRYQALRKRLYRARVAGRVIPTPVAKDGNADLYRVGDLLAWFADELGLADAEPAEADR
jgi:hypothetical protein